MSPLTRIICLANSQKHGAHCVAGVEPETGRWLRPVSQLNDGRLTRRMRLVDGREPFLGDILAIPLTTELFGAKHQCENRCLLPGEWTCEGTASFGDIRPYCSHAATILGTNTPYIPLNDILRRPREQRASLELVETVRFSIRNIGISAQGGHKWFGAIETTGGAQLEARITDPVLIEKLENSYQPPPNCLVTISLTEPYTPDHWEEDEQPCWKVIAAVIEPNALADAPATFADHIIRGVRSKVSPADATASNIVSQTPPTVPATAPDADSSPAPEGLTEDEIYSALQHTFGYRQFRKHQKSIVRALLDAQDAMVVMPSGGGKSLCYQLPSRLLNGTCVVISPLISLMKDQVDGARANGLSAACFNSSMGEGERIDVLRHLRQKDLDLLYISPERLVMDRFRQELQRADISFFAIDEAHCISDWGHDFRPDYLYLSKLKDEFPQTPVAAFTATATPQVREDITRRLNLRSPHNILASFDRPNFFYQVVPKKDVYDQILDFVGARPGQSGVVYRTTRKDVDSTADLLQQEGINALPYHAGLGQLARAQNQEAFNKDKVDVIVATVAFGMGIDKPDVRYVIHGDLPKDLESYYQETGRAGRDGEPAHCLLLFGEGDAFKIRYFIDQMEDEGLQRRSLEKLRQMMNFAALNVCRRRHLLSYFGEDYGPEPCNSCDICCSEATAVEANKEAQILLSAVVRTGQRYGVTKIIDIVTGANTKEVRKNRLDQVKTYGAGADRPKKYWRRLVDELIGQQCLRRTNDRYPTLKLTKSGKKVLLGEKDFKIMQRDDEPTGEEDSDLIVAEADIPSDMILFDKLRQLRTQLADDAGMPPYTVFHNRALREMAAYFPTTDEKMLKITGVGDVKLKRYGEAFMDAIQEHLNENPDITPPELGRNRPTGRKKIKKTSAPPDSTYDITWKLFQSGMDCETIAAQRGLSYGTIASHFERLIMAGRDIPPERLLTPEELQHLSELFEEHGADRLAPIIENSSMDIGYEQAKWARAFLEKGVI